MSLTITDTFMNSDAPSQAGHPVIARAQAGSASWTVPGVGWHFGKPADRLTNSDVTGAWSVILPWPSESDPSFVNWLITLPDGTTWMGTVPEGVAGPVTVRTLHTTYGWTHATQEAGSTSATAAIATIKTAALTDPTWAALVTAMDW